MELYDSQLHLKPGLCRLLYIPATVGGDKKKVTVYRIFFWSSQKNPITAPIEDQHDCSVSKTKGKNYQSLSDSQL